MIIYVHNYYTCPSVKFKEWCNGGTGIVASSASLAVKLFHRGETVTEHLVALGHRRSAEVIEKGQKKSVKGKITVSSPPCPGELEMSQPRG
jgi:hypothetical protein